MHNIIGILHDIEIRADYCVGSIKANDPTNSFVKNGRALEERFKELNDRVYSDLYNQEIYYCLRYMISPVHWISVYCDQISSDESLPKDGLKSFFEKDFDILESSVSEIKKQSKQFDYEIRKKSRKLLCTKINEID